MQKKAPFGFPQIFFVSRTLKMVVFLFLEKQKGRQQTGLRFFLRNLEIIKIIIGERLREFLDILTIF